MFQTSVSHVYVGNANRCNFIHDRSEHYATGHALFHGLFGFSSVHLRSFVRLQTKYEAVVTGLLKLPSVLCAENEPEADSAFTR